ncbi:MAG: hypothetical protein UIK34_09520, partial [Christensenellales bacterium]|nr:hypothetical protein [Christensenellales bacterium]
KIHCLVYFPQQMLLWHQAIYSYYLYYMTVHFPTFQHLFHHLLLILPLINEKAQLLLDFFDRLKEAAICRFFFCGSRLEQAA